MILATPIFAPEKRFVFFFRHFQVYIHYTLNAVLEGSTEGVTVAVLEGSTEGVTVAVLEGSTEGVTVSTCIK